MRIIIGGAEADTHKLRHQEALPMSSFQVGSCYRTAAFLFLRLRETSADTFS